MGYAFYSYPRECVMSSYLTKKELARMYELRKKAEYDGRICFCIYWHTNEAEAEEHGALVRKAGYTYNGGYFHGTGCGREKYRDYTDKEGVRHYAVTA